MVISVTNQQELVDLANLLLQKFKLDQAQTEQCCGGISSVGNIVIPIGAGTVGLFKKIVFTVATSSAPGSNVPASGDTKFQLVDGTGQVLTNCDLMFFREGMYQYEGSDFTFNQGTSILTVTEPFQVDNRGLGERIVILVFPLDTVVKSIIGAAPIVIVQSTGFPYTFPFTFN